jgi:hypothetical protein
VQLVAAACAGVVCAKFVLVAASGAWTWVVLGVALAAVVIETAYWATVLTRRKPVYELYVPDDFDGPSQAYRPAISSSALLARSGVQSLAHYVCSPAHTPPATSGGRWH